MILDQIKIMIWSITKKWSPIRSWSQITRSSDHSIFWIHGSESQMKFLKNLLNTLSILIPLVIFFSLAIFLKISYVIQTYVFRKLSDLMIEWSEITIWLAITFLWCSRSWSWSDLRSLFEQVILIWSQITFRVILQFFGNS